MLLPARRLGYMVNDLSPSFLVFSAHAIMPCGYVELGALPLVSTFTQVKPCLFSNGLRKALRKTNYEGSLNAEAYRA
jgi:hypothetical protein